MLKKDISRRDLLKMSSVTALGILGGSSLGGCTPKPLKPSDNHKAANSTTPEFLKPPEAITDFIDTKEFDIVIVGAGNAGISAAKTANDAGVKVAVLQRESSVITQGIEAASIDLEKTTPAAIEACVSMIIKENNHRANRALVQAWAHNSSEAIRAWESCVTSCGVEGTPKDYSIEYQGYPIFLHLANYEEIEGNYNTVTTTVSKKLANDGVTFFYDTPASQLHKSGDRIDGVIATSSSGSTLYKASKGVILATGDYQNNEDMVAYYMPDCLGLKTGALNKYGDGHRMGVWAGGHIENINHCKMVHEGLGGRRCDVPFLAVNALGNRFMCEGPTMAYTNNYWHSIVQKTHNQKAGIFYQICDANWKTQGAEMVAVDPFNNDISEVKQERFVTGNTIEELGEAINAYCTENQIDWRIDVSGLVKSVERYNKLVASGTDDDYGKNPAYLMPIDTPPFYGIRRGDGGVAALLGGLVIDENCRVLDRNDNPLKGLYATGNVSGPFFGGVDYPMYIHGLSIGRALTTGFIAARFASSQS